MTLSKSTIAQEIYARKAKGKPVGTGQRFQALTEALAKKGAKHPKALAAFIGRKKYGKGHFQSMANKARIKALSAK